MRGLIVVVVVVDDDTIGSTGPPTIHFKLIHKVRQVLLQIATGITKCNDYLQSAIEHGVDFLVARKHDKLDKVSLFSFYLLNFK